MWNFTEDGFTSVVEYSPPATSWDKEQKKNVPFRDGVIDKLPSDYHAADEETLSSHVLVRARIKEDLDALKAYDTDAIETEDKTADYQFRLVIRRAAYAQYMYDKVMLLDYTSHVKETIDKRAPQISGGRYRALSSIWSACAQWQPHTPWGGTVSYGGYGNSSYKSYSDQSTKPVSYYDSSLGRWIYPKGSQTTGGGGATPKAVTDGKSVSAGVKLEFKDALEEAFAEADRRAAQNEADKDNPWQSEPSDRLPVGVTDDGIKVTADATRATMIAQVKDILKETGQPCADIEALIDELEETFGTCDIESIPSEVLSDMLVDYESVSHIMAGM